jgi:hypothetical protein
MLEEFQREGINPVPEHSKLQHYSTRRMQHLIKLSMISSLSRGLSRRVIEADIERARDWLIEAEETMPDIFKEMAFKSDLQIIQDLHFFLWKIYLKEKKPIHLVRLRHFLLAKVPSDKIDRIIDMAVNANILTEASQGLYIPRPKQEHGIE